MLQIRPSTADEIPQQKDLWKKCQRHSNAYIDAFYERFCTPDQVLVVEEGGEIDCMAAMIPTTLRLPDGDSAPAALVYALSTNPYLQGKGHARQLLNYADTYLQERGIKAMTLAPASPSLHRFFETVGMRECFATRKVEILSSSLTGDTGGGVLTPISSAEYNAIRDERLKGIFYMSYTDHLVEFQRIGSHLTSGDLYKIEVDGEVGCVAIEYVQKTRLLLRELLISPDKMAAAVETVAKELEAYRYHVRTPAHWEGLPGSYLQAFGMIKWYDEALHAKWFSSQDGYLGLGFD